MASADPQSAEPATGGAHPQIVVVGPPGTGKTDLSLHLAERIRETGRDAEVVNADAMQFYRGMDIGTAKLPPAEWRRIPHLIRYSTSRTTFGGTSPRFAR